MILNYVKSSSHRLQAWSDNWLPSKVLDTTEAAKIFYIIETDPVASKVNVIKILIVVVNVSRIDRSKGVSFGSLRFHEPIALNISIQNTSFDMGLIWQNCTAAPRLLQAKKKL